MTRESLAFALSGTFFGLIVGWIIGSQQGAPAVPAPAAPAAASAPASGPAAAPALDQARVSRLEQQAGAEPRNATVRVDLGNLYFDAEQYDRAIPWYEAAVALEPTNVNASTDLGVAYYYSNQVDKALAQFDKSLAIDSRHVKTLLNQGIVRAFGKRDLAGAGESWQRVVEIAPDSEEGRKAKQGLDSLQSAAHQALGAGAGSTASPGGATGASGRE
jgi:tetratricopeptide (TPR) repeat protein